MRWKWLFMKKVLLLNIACTTREDRPEIEEHVLYKYSSSHEMNEEKKGLLEKKVQHMLCSMFKNRKFASKTARYVCGRA